jgi:hypothetical protein
MQQVKVRNRSGAEWVIDMDPGNWATEHMRRQIDNGDLTVVEDKPKRVAKKASTK